MYMYYNDVPPTINDGLCQKIPTPHHAHTNDKPYLSSKRTGMHMYTRTSGIYMRTKTDYKAVGVFFVMHVQI